ncbi:MULTISPECIES: lysylphosphatidylglycerol synthase transmembrane domain-containing protein [Thermomonosporaceae]|uniref:lysylphosphatidylglycerol synthase transmembrane domain-containing protein n=1 Tax=Thermomonosporaceae TaxID=2012 RepID=UPI00255B1014|nr:MULTISPECIES: lysylphosphatidylglycerol synthase transmembrane domain-containing protein [Thermomonosporaceae]MDL4776574.1 lysylphosphatidylglycerol synthase transmembrane domain-containing protein [Actinomadura xylanilytica]
MPVDEPPRPDRIRRPADAIRFAAALAGLAAIMLLVSIAQQTTHGLQTDIAEGTAHAPRLLLSLATLASSFGVLAVPVAFAVERLLHKDGMRVAIALLAAVIAFGLTVVLDDWVVPAAPGGVLDSLIWGGTETAPVHTDIAPVIAFVSAVGMTGRARWQAATWTMIGLAALTGLTAAYASVAALAATYLLGRAIGHGTLYAVGTPNPRPPGAAVVAALERIGLRPVRARSLCDDDLPVNADDPRRYAVTLGPAPDAAPGGDGLAAAGNGHGPSGAGQRLEVRVLDRDQQSAGLFYRIWRLLRLRGATTGRALRSLRRSLEQESLMAYAVDASGARTPRLVGTAEVGTQAALLAYAQVPGRPLGAVPDDDLTDALLSDVWRQFQRLQASRLAHRRLEGEAILVGDDGLAYITDLRAGEISAGDLALRLDLAQLLTTLALRTGPERAVAGAAAVLGEEALASAVPLLQRVALSRATRSALRHDRDLLSRIREQIVRLKPETEAAPIRVERFRPRTIVSIVALTIAAYIVFPQLSSVDLKELVTSATWWWVAVALGAAAVTYLAAAFMLMGFVPERLHLGRTVLVQVAASFVKLVAPAAVGGVAMNTRYLQRSGVRPGPAVASVGASQLMSMITHILLLIIFGFITGSTHTATRDLAPSRKIVIVLLAVAVLVGAALTIRRVRRVVTGRLKAMFSGVVPRLVDVLQSPKKLCTGMGGTLLLTLGFVVCLDSCIRAFGGSLPWTAVVVVFLTANALGSAAPTPGGLGAVEGALTLALTISGLTAETATSAVLLYRLLTLWLPVLPGWAAFAYLQRKEAI